MKSRGVLFVAVICAAIAIPYFMVNDGTEPGQRLARLWDSMFHVESSHGYPSPTPSASPIPPLRNTLRPMSQAGNGTRFSNPQTGTFISPTVGTTIGQPVGSTNVAVQSPALPPGATATPWMPVDGTSPNRITSPTTNVGVVPGAMYPGIPTAVVAPGQNGPFSRKQVGPYIQHIGELFRFDLTPDWVVSNWPRVSSQLSEFTYTGLRVPVVSGTGIHDLAGSMTYYFDTQQQLQRIAFLGTTGDPSQLVQLATTQFQMRPEPSLNGSCFIAKSAETITDVLRIRHVPVTRGNQPHRRYRVSMEVNRPGSSQGLSQLNQQTLDEERKIMDFGRGNRLPAESTAPGVEESAIPASENTPKGVES